MASRREEQPSTTISKNSTTLNSSSGDGTDNSSSSASLKKPKGKTVKSRYLGYDGKTLRKGCEVGTVKQSPLLNTTLDSAGKLSDRGRSPARKSMAPQKFKVPASAQGSYLESAANVLHSTLMEGHKIDNPLCDISAICVESSSIAKMDTNVPKIEQVVTTSTVPHDVFDQMESQTLLLHYLTLQIEKNNFKLEEEAERNLLIAVEEKQKLQKKLNRLKREVLVRRTEEEQLEFLEKQVEVLEPMVAGLGNFKKEYKTFASALDTTRHELPIKNLYIEGDKQAYLDEMQQHLLVTKSLLGEVTTEQGDNAKVSNMMKKLQEVTLETDTELKRTVPDILELSSEVSKEVALHSQELFEQKHDMETIRNWYFN